MLVTFPDRSAVLAQGRLGLIESVRPRDPDFALYLDERWRGDPEVTWPHHIVEWPDFGLPKYESELFEIIRAMHGRAKGGELIEIACFGGVGRTGSVLACVAIAAGVQPEYAVQWVREHYDPRAVETDDQSELVRRFASSP